MSTWKEIKQEYVKKKAKIIFYVDRHLKIYDNGYFAYFTSGRKELKACISPNNILQCLLESKDKMKVVTKNKSYLFKFSKCKVAEEWVTTIN